MLYENESISTYSKSNFAIWMLMAFQAGLLNIGGFMACARFVSHVTGFATYFGHDIGQTHYIEAFEMLVVPLFFLFGSMTSGLLIDLKLLTHRKPRYYVAFGTIFCIILCIYFIGALGLFGKFGEGTNLFRDYILLSFLCLACGVQNGTVTSVSKAVVRTTHLTGITTDLGLGIVRFLNKDLIGKEVSNEGKANLMRIGVIFFFGFGSTVGAFAFAKFGFLGFILPTLTSGALFITTLVFHIYRKKTIVVGS